MGAPIRWREILNFTVGTPPAGSNGPKSSGEVMSLRYLHKKQNRLTDWPQRLFLFYSDVFAVQKEIFFTKT